jgi:CubicO group peptidase (beta-lactamase class C family)
LAAILVDDGTLRWDEPIRKYLPDFQLHDPWISEHVTLRDVLANRTGLSRASICEYGSDLSRAEVLRRARDIEPACGFRDQFTTVISALSWQPKRWRPRPACLTRS